jgi:Restriction endonuclease fold toxin 7
VYPRRSGTLGPGSAAGKLKEASGFNWRMGAVCGAFEVRQDFFYDPTTGRLSIENTSLWDGPGALEQWTQSYAYDGAGRITQVNYPSCTSVCSSPPRQVTTAYSMGRPTSVSGYASAITYHDNGTLATIQHANHVAFTETADPHGMARPGALQADSPSGQPWPLETYFYDGAGNIKAIGGKTFAYDANSRIASATVTAALTLPYQAYSYDIFGNLVTLARGTSPADATYINFDVDSATNRLTGVRYDDSGHLIRYPPNNYDSYTLKIGEGTGTAIGEGQGTLSVALGVGKDAMRALTIAGALGGVSGLAGDALSGGASLARGGMAPVELGQAGEAAVRAVADIGPKQAINVAGSKRVADGLTKEVLSEVKNVKSQSLTRQLRDFMTFAGQQGLRFDLWVRPSTQLSGPLNNAVKAGLINLRYIPGP